MQIVIYCAGQRTESDSRQKKVTCKLPVSLETYSLSYSSFLLFHSGLEPAWSSEIQQDTGELFYIEASQDPSSPNIPKHQNESNGNKKKKKSPLPIPKLMRKKKEQRPEDITDNLKRTSLKRTSFLSKTGSIKEVCLRLDKQNDIGVTRTSKLESWLGIVGAGIPLGSSTFVANGNREHQNGGPVKHEGILVKGLLPSSAAIKSGDIDIGKLVLFVFVFLFYVHLRIDIHFELFYSTR